MNRTSQCMKQESVPVEAWTGPEGSRRLRFPDFNTEEVVRLSALGTDHLYPTGNTPGTHFRQRLSGPQGNSKAGRIRSMKNSNDTSGIEPATFRLAAQCLSELRHTWPRILQRTGVRE